jgi:hypothetical protein
MPRKPRIEDSGAICDILCRGGQRDDFSPKNQPGGRSENDLAWPGKTDPAKLALAWIFA